MRAFLRGDPMTQAELLARLGQCKTWKTDLSPMGALAAKLGDPQKNLRFIHVAGTNGKGSTCAMVSSVLTAAGYRTGRFVSPYILEFRERIQIDGHMIPADDLCRIGSRVVAALDELEREEIYPTEFDAVTMIGFLWFWEQQCDMVVLEVGVGGRIDSTNLVSPDTVLVSAITTIALDHTAILGNTVGEIAGEKAGIIKAGGVTVLGPSISGEALAVIRAAAAEKENRLHVAETAGLHLLESGPGGLTFGWRGLTLSLPMPGLYQQENLAIALSILSELEGQGWAISDEAIVAGLGSTAFPARMELVGEAPLFWLDGAHNPAGIRALAATLEALAPGRKRVCIHGMMEDKDCGAGVAVLASVFDQAVTVTVENPRALSADGLAALWQQAGVPAEPAADCKDALGRAVELAGEEGAVVCCGSLFLCAEMRPLARDYYRGREK